MAVARVISKQRMAATIHKIKFKLALLVRIVGILSFSLRNQAQRFWGFFFAIDFD
jgi:hypothetical protein